jgi:hypothetical protein
LAATLGLAACSKSPAECAQDSDCHPNQTCFLGQCLSVRPDVGAIDASALDATEHKDATDLDAGEQDAPTLPDAAARDALTKDALEHEDAFSSDAFSMDAPSQPDAFSPDAQPNDAGVVYHLALQLEMGVDHYVVDGSGATLTDSLATAAPTASRPAWRGGHGLEVAISELPAMVGGVTNVYAIPNPMPVDTTEGLDPDWGPGGISLVTVSGSCLNIHANTMTSCTPIAAPAAKPRYQPSGGSTIAVIELAGDAAGSYIGLYGMAISNRVGAGVHNYAWAPDGSALAVLVSAANTCDITYNALLPGPPTYVIVSGVSCSALLDWTTGALAITADGASATDIYVVDPSVPNGALGALRPVMSVPGMALELEYTPDGQHLVIAASMTGLSIYFSPSANMGPAMPVLVGLAAKGLFDVY